MVGSILNSAARKASGVTGVLNPMVRVCIWVTPVFLATGYKLALNAKTFPLGCFCIGVAVVPVIVFCGAFIGFSMLSPDRLQSEEFQLKVAGLKLVADKTSSVTLSAVALQDITELRSSPDRDRDLNRSAVVAS